MLQIELETRTKELSENAELLNQQVSEEHFAKGCLPQYIEGVSILFLLTNLDFIFNAVSMHLHICCSCKTHF